MISENSRTFFWLLLLFCAEQRTTTTRPKGRGSCCFGEECIDVVTPSCACPYGSRVGDGGPHGHLLAGVLLGGVLLHHGVFHHARARGAEEGDQDEGESERERAVSKVRDTLTPRHSLGGKGGGGRVGVHFQYLYDGGKGERRRRSSKPLSSTLITTPLQSTLTMPAALSRQCSSVGQCSSARS
jgi:hypothetical protein